MVILIPGVGVAVKLAYCPNDIPLPFLAEANPPALACCGDPDDSGELDAARLRGETAATARCAEEVEATGRE